MKVIPRKETPTKQPPILPLTLEEDSTEHKTVSHVLRITPAQADSATYKMSTRVLTGTENVRTIIKKHPSEIKKVLVGLNCTNIGNKVTFVRTLVDGNALTQFNASVERVVTARFQKRILDAADDAAAQAINAAGWNHANNYHNDDFDAYLNGMVEKLVPAKALAKVKRTIRRNSRKPADMGVRTYFQNLFRINTQEIPFLPPFDPNQGFREDEFIDIILFGTPKSWAQEMERQGFDPMDHTAEEVVAFMEQIEAAEELDKAPKVESKNKAAAMTKKKGSSSGDRKKGGTKHCEVHGDCNHTTEECRSLKRAKRSDDRKPDAKGNKYGNKTWKRKAEDNAADTSKEVALLVKKMLRKELNSLDKKRKAKSSDDEEAFNIDVDDLDGFNYDDMDKMDIKDDDSDGEVSC